MDYASLLPSVSRTWRDDIARWEDVGVTRLFATPWTRSREAIDSLARYAELVLG